MGKRRFPGENHRQDGAQGKHVGPGIHRFAPGLLRGNVRRRANDHARLGLVVMPGGRTTGLAGRLRLPDDFGDPPVHHLHFAKLTDHDVGRFEVAVDHSPGMGKARRLGDLFENPKVS